MVFATTYRRDALTGQILTRCNEITRVTARRLRQEHDAHLPRYLRGGHPWSPSYFAGSCDGPPLTAVHDYIDNQKYPNS
ncbi:transposase [Micromonospora zhanjiangensis]|uniref:Transposase n=1 Tax=Micromonospora zhanjiangensis TaxID=1522057 RepID=A0ABV8KU97_9ACTN